MLIQENQSILLFAVLVFAAYIGLQGDYRKWFGKVSGALITITLTAIFTSLNLIPSAADPDLTVPSYQFVYNYIIPISIPLLLFNANLKIIIKTAGRLSLLFLIGALGIVLGAIIAYYLLGLGEEGPQIAGVYVATYTGGSVNFMSVAKSLDFLQSPTFPAVITIDNVFTNLFFFLLFLLPAIHGIARRFIPYQETSTSAEEVEETRAVPLINTMSGAILIAAVIVATSKGIDEIIASSFSIGFSTEVLLITFFAVLATNVFPKYFQRIADDAFQIGMFLLFVFLAVIGAACDIPELILASPKLILFVTITLLIHLGVILFAGYLLKYSLEETLVASAANAGGPSISAALASNFGMKEGMTPAVLVGILGYVIGTFLGIGVGLFLN